jgi:hypothetical protein
MAEGSPLSTPVDAPVTLLAAEARDNRLAICAGAGVSIPAGLPSGPELARKLHERFKRVAGYNCPTPENLLAVADAAASLPEGLAVVQRAVLELAPFSEAPPQLAHRLLALLLAEDALRLLVTNWDDCVERSWRASEHIPSACNADDAESLRGQFVVKIHGCCTQADTLLITSEQLDDEAPLWAKIHFGGELNRSTMVFVGIGDVADYARHRITELSKLIDHGRVRIVSPDIVASWDASMWREVLPELPESRRIEATANDFLDQLAREWVMSLVAEVRAATPEAPWLAAVADAFVYFTAVQALEWLRRAAMKWRVGESVVRTPGAASALEAIALKAREPSSPAVRMIRFLRASAVRIGDERFEVLICPERLTTADIEELASQRAQRVVQSLGPRDELNLLVAASSIRGPKPGHLTGLDVVDPDEPIDDVVGGARQVSARLTYVDDVLAAA